MKQVKILSAVAFLSFILLCGCKKDSAFMATAVDAKLVNANVNYHLVTVPQPANSVLLWNSGYVSASSIAFDGTHIVGNALKLKEFTTTINYNDLLFQTMNLGNVSVTPSFYNNASVIVTIKPGGRPHSLFLYGSTINQYNREIPVELIIDDEIQLKSVWLDNVTMTAGARYLSTIYLDMAHINQGITFELLNGATITDGAILISSVSNTTLYNIILTNLADRMNVLFAPASILNPGPDQAVSVTPSGY